MSLGRLLTAGKSLVGLKNPSGRYEMRSRHLLPKFGSGANPFSAPAAPDAEPISNATAPSPSASTEAPPVYQRSAAELAAARLKETKRLPVPPPAPPVAAEPAGPGRLKRVLGVLRDRLAVWARKCDPRSWRIRLPKKAVAVPRPGRSAVQGELSLDRVKVVRNDLSDADVEVLPVKASTRARPEPKTRAQARTETPADETAELIKS